MIVCSIIRRPPRSPRTDPLLPYTTLCLFVARRAGRKKSHGFDRALADGARTLRRKTFDRPCVIEHRPQHREALPTEGALQIACRLARRRVQQRSGGRIDGPLHQVRQIVDIAVCRGHRAEAEGARRSEEHTSELQSLMRISYAVLCLKKKN